MTVLIPPWAEPSTTNALISLDRSLGGLILNHKEIYNAVITLNVLDLQQVLQLTTIPIICGVASCSTV
jgi:hypothetical protein